jgi:hypothetical protein
VTWFELIWWSIRLLMLFSLVTGLIAFAFLVWEFVEVATGRNEPYDFDDEEEAEPTDCQWRCMMCDRWFPSSMGVEHPERHYLYHHRRIAIGPEDSIRWKI